MRTPNTPHDLKVGQIVWNSWGYDQTNIDFYLITKVTKFQVYLRKLKSKTTETGFMCGPTEPIIGEFATVYNDDPIESRHSVRSGYAGGDKWCVNFKYGCGYIWDGKPQQCSWYA